MSLRFIIFVTLLFFVSLSGAHAADTISSYSKPKWEYGIGGGAIQTPSYPASDDSVSRRAMLPFFIYRGDKYAFGDRGFFRARQFLSEKIEIDLSFGASFNAQSEDDPDRENMPDLDYLFEVGPQIIYHAVKQESAAGQHSVDFELRTRAVFSSDFNSLDRRGTIFEPAVQYEYTSARNPDRRISIDLEIIYATQKLADYFYEVAPDYVQENRPRYNARAGYIGSEIGASMSLPIGKDLRLFFSTQIGFYKGAKNSDSPLFKKDVTYSTGMGMIYRIGESTERVWR